MKGVFHFSRYFFFFLDSGNPYFHRRVMDPAFAKKVAAFLTPGKMPEGKNQAMAFRSVGARRGNGHRIPGAGTGWWEMRPVCDQQ